MTGINLTPFAGRTGVKMGRGLLQWGSILARLNVWYQSKRKFNKRTGMFSEGPGALEQWAKTRELVEKDLKRALRKTKTVTQSASKPKKYKKEAP